MTVREALLAGARALARHSCDGTDALREAELLLAFACDADRGAFAARPDAPVAPRRLARFRGLLRRRARHAPLAYLVGTAEFAGLAFAVSKATLIPRPATEHILDAALAAAEGGGRPLIVDVGTGSGCIAVAAAVRRPDALIVATDASAAALAVARKNAARHGVAARVRILRGDLAAPALRTIAHAGRAVVAANLPYIPSAAVRRLPLDVRGEPRSALDGGSDGLALYRRLFDQLCALRAGLSVVCECLPEQASRLAALAERKLPGARTEEVVNFQDVAVGVRLDRPAVTA